MMPFIPPLMTAAGLSASEVGGVMAMGAAARLVAGPLGGRIADALGRPKAVMAGGALLAAAAACLYGLAQDLTGLLAANLLMALGFASVVPLGDALALRAAREEGWDYGRVRALGSAAFIATAGLAGWLAEFAGAGSIAWLLAASMAVAAAAALAVPSTGVPARRGGGAVRSVLALPAFRRILVVSALIQGSHAAYYAFGSIHWEKAGVPAGAIGLLWAWSVVAEVALFAWGRGIADRLGPRGLAFLAAAAGVLRWGIMAETVALPGLVVAQALHALTFGAMHLATMRVMQAAIPAGIAGTAQTLLAAGIGGATMAGTLVTGQVFAAHGSLVFWGMAAMCVIAVPGARLLPRRYADRP